MSKKNSHTDAPPIRVGEWATASWCCKSIGYKSPSHISHKVCAEIIKMFKIKKKDFVINERNERNDGKGKFAFYKVELLKRWAKEKGLSVNEEIEQESLFDKYNSNEPVGLRPKWLVDMERVKEIREAISRYWDAGKKVPEAWIEEIQSYMK